MVGRGVARVSGERCVPRARSALSSWRPLLPPPCPHPSPSNRPPHNAPPAPPSTPPGRGRGRLLPHPAAANGRHQWPPVPGPPGHARRAAGPVRRLQRADRAARVSGRGDGGEGVGGRRWVGEGGPEGADVGNDGRGGHASPFPLPVTRHTPAHTRHPPLLLFLLDERVQGQGPRVLVQRHAQRVRRHFPRPQVPVPLGLPRGRPGVCRH